MFVHSFIRTVPSTSSEQSEDSPKSEHQRTTIMNVSNINYVAGEKMQRMKFEYLGDLYYDYNRKITKLAVKYNRSAHGRHNKDHELHKMNETNDTHSGSGGSRSSEGTGHGFLYYRQALFRMYCYIFEEFIGETSEHQVNLSAETSEELVALFGNGMEDQSVIDRFRRFEDFMFIFDTALIEIYQLAFGIYAYRFKKWLNAQ